MWIRHRPQKGRATPEKNITVEFPGVKVKISTAGLTLEALEENDL